MFFALFLFAQEVVPQPQPAWLPYFNYGQTVVLVVVILGWALRALPYWKEVRMRDADVKSEDNVVKREMAVALGRLADVLKDIAVEQRRATESVEITQSVAADTSERLSNSLAVVTHRIETVEEHLTRITPSTLQGAAAQ